jgi:hypothetical protein
VPAVKELLGIFPFTKLFAAMIESLPIEIPSEIREPIPRKQLSPIITLPARIEPGAKKF